MIVWFSLYNIFCFSVYDGVPRTKQQIDAVAGGFLGEAKREG